MKIRIPNPLVRAWDRFGDWSNVPIFHMKGNDPNCSPYTQAEITIRRIDVIIALGFVGCVGWYGYSVGWRGALLGGVLYLAIMAMALWVF